MKAAKEYQGIRQVSIKDGMRGDDYYINPANLTLASSTPAIPGSSSWLRLKNFS
jgi:hypothetical protein